MPYDSGLAAPVSGRSHCTCGLVIGALIDAALWMAAADGDEDERLEKASRSVQFILNRML